MLPERTRRKADVVVCLLFILFGLFLFYEASRMPWASTRTGAQAQWFLSPGLFPATIGALLILFSLRVLATAIAQGGHKGIWATFAPWLRGLPTNRGVQRVALMILLIGTFIFAGIGRIDFRLAGSLFLFTFIGLFWWPFSGEAPVRRTLVTLAISLAVPAVIAYLFSTFLYVPMP